MVNNEANASAFNRYPKCQVYNVDKIKCNDITKLDSYDHIVYHMQ
jgi:hypothetical protein